jgi:aminoglycoside phosphotransferase (APT) family kinase protein
VAAPLTAPVPAIDAALVGRLIAEQFPHWAALPVRPVAAGGWDNRTFHLGDRMTVRLPSAPGYAPQVEKEQRWLPLLGPRLPLPVPAPLARGAPSGDFPLPWSVYGWIDGDPATTGAITDRTRFAVDLAVFLRALAAVDPAGGPGPGSHNGFRGAPPAVYDDETRAAVADLRDVLPAARVLAVWDAALAATATGAPVWFHGDVAPGNLLVRGGRLAAVIDFGSCGVGDPACDLAIAWTMFTGDSRRAFRAGRAADPGMWARGRGWALWKALITWAGCRSTDPARVAESRTVVQRILADDTPA